MKFGKVEHPEEIDFSLPPTPKETKKVLNEQKSSQYDNLRIGCAKWNRKDLRNFYPRGTKDELAYYSTQFNAIELNASFYRIFPEEQFRTWDDKTGDDFQFFPKIPRYISHTKRLKDTERIVDDFVTNLQPIKKKIGSVFLQMPNNFHPKNLNRLEPFFMHWPAEIPLAAEFRHTNWYNDKEVEKELYRILEVYNISNIITDSAGRRDLLHMRLTNATAFIRYVGTNHESDFTRLDEWLEKLQEWYKAGLKNIYFFVHQNVEKRSPLLSAYFIENFNKRFGTDLKIPKTL